MRSRFCPESHTLRLKSSNINVKLNTIPILMQHMRISTTFLLSGTQAEKVGNQTKIVKTE
jgi:hypothetical protein